MKLKTYSQFSSISSRQRDDVVNLQIPDPYKNERTLDKTIRSGNINPVFIETATKEDVTKACIEAIKQEK
jgi:hypothetical protein